MKTTRGGLLLLASAFVAVAAFGHGGGRSRGASSSRTPLRRPPALPAYQGRVFRVPNSTPRPVAPRGAAPPPQGPQRRSPVGTPIRKAEPVRPAEPRGPAAAPAAPSALRSPFRPPERDQNGKPVLGRPITDMSKDAAIVRKTVANPDLARSIQNLTRDESERDGKFHWHARDDFRFSHWYDKDHDRQWFGFYRGGGYYWTIAWHDHFWWRDPGAGRWLVYWRDHWWWHSPQGVFYIFIGDQYYRWNPNANGAVLVPAPAAPSPASGAPAGEGTETSLVSSVPEFNYSADGTRMVAIEGEKLSAYLYDPTSMDHDGGNRFVKYLGDDVTAVAFSDTSRGDPLRITLSVQDGRGAIHQVVLDADGEPVGAGAPRPQPAPPPVVFGTPGAPGFDAPAVDLPPTDSPMPDGN